MKTSDKIVDSVRNEFQTSRQAQQMLGPTKITAAAWVPVVPINLCYYSTMKGKELRLGCLP